MSKRQRASVAAGLFYTSVRNNVNKASRRDVRDTLFRLFDVAVISHHSRSTAKRFIKSYNPRRRVVYDA